MEIKIIYEDKDVLVVDKPAKIMVYSENPTEEETLVSLLLKKYPELKNAGIPPRYGLVHRLDKDTSGVILVAKNNDVLDFLQKQFKEKQIEKRYIGLVVGNMQDEQGRLETLMGRSPSDRLKQKVYLEGDPDAAGKRKAITEYKVLERFNNHTLLELFPKTGRTHQLRCHLSYLSHPVAGDELYGFKNQPTPPGLARHFLHSNSVKFALPNGEVKEIKSDLPDELNNILINLRKQSDG